jgi:hypothetical protein
LITEKIFVWKMLSYMIKWGSIIIK